MANRIPNLRIDTGEIPSAIGVEGAALGDVIGRWVSIANGRFPNDCRALLQMVDETDQLRLWEKRIHGLGSKDRNDFLRNHVLIDFNLTEKMLSEIVDRLRQGESAAMRLAADPKLTPLAAHGEIGGGHEKDGHANSGQQGTSAAYLVRRLKRDAPEIALALARGEFKSARAAAIEAGIITPPTPFEIILKQLPRITSQERRRLRDML
jgi:hypothetical protein